MTLANHRNFDSYGRIVSETNPARDFAYAYTGREFDETTGKQYNRTRWYDASVGRWMSEDPIGFAGGSPNRQVYVGNDPARLTDPSGLWPSTRSDFNNLVDDVASLIESGTISACAGFAYLMGMLYEFDRRNIAQWLNDAIFYFIDPELARIYHLDTNLPGGGTRPSGDAWTPPASFQNHSTPARCGYRCLETDEDFTGHRAHFLVGAIAEFYTGLAAGIGLKLGRGLDEDLRCDRRKEILGGSLIRRINIGKANIFQTGYQSDLSGDQIARSIFEALCSDIGTNCTKRGFIDKNTMLELIQISKLPPRTR